MATDALNSSNPGHEHILEWCNEVWSNDFATVAAYGMAELGVLQASSGNLRNHQVAMSARAYWLWRTVFDAAGRGKEVKLAISGQFTNSGITTSIASAVASYNAANPSKPAVWDYHPLGVYYDGASVPEHDPTMLQAQGLVYKANAGSIANGSSNNAWTMEQWCELLRHAIKYRFLFNGSVYGYGASGWLSQIIASLAGYTAVGPQPTGYTPQMVGYEGAVQGLVRAIDVSGHALQNIGTHDAQYTPGQRFVQWAFYEALQLYGFKFINLYNYCMMRWSGSNTPGGASANSWGNYQWSGQTYGLGDGSDGKAVNQLSGTGTATSYDLVNVSVMGQAWRDWADVANMEAAAVSGSLTGNNGASIVFNNFNRLGASSTFPGLLAIDTLTAQQSSAKQPGGAAYGQPPNVVWPDNVNAVVMIDGFETRLPVLGYLKSGAFHVALNGTTAVTVPLTNTATNSTTFVGNTTFTQTNVVMFRNIGGAGDGLPNASITIAPGATNGAVLGLGVNSTIILDGAGSLWWTQTSNGFAVNSAAANITFTPTNGGNVICVVGGK
jgi:hypothetical protein